MSTLFGHVRGAFTGAHAERAGLLKAADKGMLFLDVNGELGFDEQATWPACDRGKEVSARGRRPVRTSADFQLLLAGTNRDLGISVRERQSSVRTSSRASIRGRFGLPSLRDRREDIEPNLEFELQPLLGSVRDGSATFNTRGARPSI